MTTPIAAGPLDRRVGQRLTPWFPVKTKPRRPGVYRVQTPTITCGCCWTNAHYDGDGGWWVYGTYGTLKVRQAVDVTRWRGLLMPNVKSTAPMLHNPDTDKT